MAGSITSIGIGSGLDLQNILDQLREADEAVITTRKNEISGLQEKVDAYHSVNAKLYAIKSNALNLSLESNFLSNTVTVADESVISATIGDGYEPASYSLSVSQMAKKSSWASSQISSKSDHMVAEPSSGISAIDTPAITQDQILTLYRGEYGGEKSEIIAAGTTDASFAINGVNIGAVTVLDQDSDGALVNAINAKTDEHGVTASIRSDGKLILKSAAHEPIDITMDANTQVVFGGSTTLEDNAGRATFNISLTAGMTMGEVVETINGLAGNSDGQGGSLFTATTVLADNGDYYIRVYDATGGNTTDAELMVGSGPDWIAADKTVTIAQGEDNMVLSVPPGASYQDVAGLINDHDDNPGVTAKLIDNGKLTTPYQFILTANDTGEEARISLSNLSVLSEVTGKSDSLNAVFEVDGVTYHRQSNTGISDVITGVTLELKKGGANVTTTLNIQSNMADVKEDITAMVNGFNDLIAFIHGKEAKSDASEDESKEDASLANPLGKDTSANRIVSQLKGLITSVIDLDGGYTSLTDLGLKVNRDGTITIDESQLDSAIAKNPNGVRDLFIGDAKKEIKGLGDLFNDTISDMVSSTGVSSSEIDENESKIDRIEDDMTAQSRRLDKKYDTMTRQFAEMDKVISQLNSQANALASMINALSGNKNDR